MHPMSSIQLTIQNIICLCDTCDGQMERELRGKFLHELCQCDAYTRWICHGCFDRQQKELYTYIKDCTASETDDNSFYSQFTDNEGPGGWPSRPPKTKETVDSSEPEPETSPQVARGRGRALGSVSPTRGPNERPRTRSISRARADASPARPTVVVAVAEGKTSPFKAEHKSKSRSRTKMAEVVSGERSDSGEADDEQQPKKKRKVAA